MRLSRWAGVWAGETRWRAAGWMWRAANFARAGGGGGGGRGGFRPSRAPVGCEAGEVVLAPAAICADTIIKCIARPRYTSLPVNNRQNTGSQWYGGGAYSPVERI